VGLPLNTTQPRAGNVEGSGASSLTSAPTELFAAASGPTKCSVKRVALRFAPTAFAIRKASAGPAQSNSKVSGRTTNSTSIDVTDFKRFLH
jgi:hypothetical protein